MIRILSLLAGLALLSGGCSGLALQEGVGEEVEALPRQLQARQLIVTLAPATPEVWATLAKELSGEYGLDQVGAFPLTSLGVQCVVFHVRDRKSTRLNSSHGYTSYAVFCLKKKIKILQEGSSFDNI